MKRERFEGEIWECACGAGRMVKVLEKYNRVKASDIKDGTDFLVSSERVNNVVTNPPYRLAIEFVEHSLIIASNKVALFLRLNFLEGQSRYRFFKSTPLKVVYVFSKRQTLYPEELGAPNNGGTIAYGWFVWDKSYSSSPTIDWIND